MRSFVPRYEVVFSGGIFFMRAVKNLFEVHDVVSDQRRYSVYLVVARIRLLRRSAPPLQDTVPCEFYTGKTRAGGATLNLSNLFLLREMEFGGVLRKLAVFRRSFLQEDGNGAMLPKEDGIFLKIKCNRQPHCSAVMNSAP